MDTEKTVGTILREARLAKGLSLAEVEKGTSIRSRYLEAVEKDEYDKTPVSYTHLTLPTILLV